MLSCRRRFSIMEHAASRDAAADGKEEKPLLEWLNERHLSDWKIRLEAHDIHTPSMLLECLKGLSPKQVADTFEVTMGSAVDFLAAATTSRLSVARARPRRSLLPIITKGPVEVHIGVKFLSILNVNMTEQTFFCDIIIVAEWRHQDPNWSPRFSIENTVDAEILLDSGVQRVPGSTSWMKQTKQVRGDFYEYLELEEFPFDTQELSVVIRSGLPANKVTLLQHDRRHNTMNRSIKLTEWILIPGITSEQHWTKQSQSAKGQSYSTLIIKVRVQRLWKFYLVNIAMIVFFLSTASLFGFVYELSEENISSRMDVNLTVILTVVVFKQSIMEKLPRVPYQTKLDRYVLLCFFFVFVVITENVTVWKFAPEDKIYWVDHLCFYALTALWVLIHVLLGFEVLRRSRPAPPRILLVNGPEGCGKRTHSRRLADRYGLPLIRPGTLVRAEMEAQARKKSAAGKSLATRISRSVRAMADISPTREAPSSPSESKNFLLPPDATSADPSTPKVTFEDSADPLSRVLSATEQQIADDTEKEEAKAHLSSDQMMAKILKQAIRQCPRGFVMNDFPRTEQQRLLFKSLLGRHRITRCIIILLSEEESLRRSQGRLVHKASGRRYHVTYAPPIQDSKDDVTGEELEPEFDAQTLKRRNHLFFSQTMPVLMKYDENIILQVDEDQAEEMTPGELFGYLARELDKADYAEAHKKRGKSWVTTDDLLHSGYIEPATPASIQILAFLVFQVGSGMTFNCIGDCLQHVY
eukprot:g10113.t1